MEDFFRIGRKIPRFTRFSMQARQPDTLLYGEAGHGLLISLACSSVLSSPFEHITKVLVQGSSLLLSILRGKTRCMGFEEGKGTLEGRNRFGIRVNMAGNLADAMVVGNGLYRQACMLIMGGDLPADGIQVCLSPRRGARVDLFEGFGHPTMQEALMRGTQGNIGLLSELVVAEVVGLSRSCALHAHHASLPELIQPLHHGILTLPAGPCKHGERELASDDRRHVCKFMRQRGELGEPCSKDGLNCWREG